jgi:hypothetical protein
VVRRAGLAGLERKSAQLSECLGARRQPRLSGAVAVLNIPVYENLVLGQEHRFTKAAFVDRRAMIRVARRIVEDAGLKIDVRRETGAYDFSSGSRSRSRGPA